MAKKLTFDHFIKRSIKRHGNKYDYSEVNIIDAKNKVKIICPIHNNFYQRPTDHYVNGCPKCGKYSTTEKFILKSTFLHGDKYDYSLVNYINNVTPVQIICKEHGIFYQTPHHHLLGCNCPECSFQQSKVSKEQFIIDSIKVHGDKYDYSKIVMVNCKNKIKIICKIHGEFEQTPDNHKRGKGCPICKESYGEKKIRVFLKNKNIKFITQKTFEGCKSKFKLPFDFYLPDYNICIEYDGIQHFESVEYFGGEIVFNETRIRDEIKNEYCRNNNIHLIRIRYDENVENLLNF